MKSLLDLGFFKIEKSPSDRATCHMCGGSIKKYTARLGYLRDLRYASYRFICNKCSIKFMKNTQDDIKKLIYRLRHFDEIELEKNI